MSDAPDKPAVVLTSGGLDSATVLAIAREAGYDCYCLSFDYGQRHRVELQAAADVARSLGARQHKIVAIDLGSIGGSALTDHSIPVPTEASEGIPVTYVPARNTVFPAIALGWAEVLESVDLFIGVNAVDYFGYPDCRPAFIDAFQTLANVATRAGIEGHQIRIHTPLINLTKAEIITIGFAAGVDYGQTVSCYQPDDDGRACVSIAPRRLQCR